SPRLAPCIASRPLDRATCATLSPIARGLSAAVHARSTRARAPRGHASSWCRAPPAHTVRRAHAARDETGGGGPVHHLPRPIRAAPDLPTRRALPNTAPGAFDSKSLVARDMRGVVARRVPIPQVSTNGSRAGHAHAHRRSP